jgi:acetyl-CoA carboxylase biotin carboxyl carrier protein
MDDANRIDYLSGIEGEETAASVISVEQLQRLVQLLDQSDVTELELERTSEGLHLALRKLKAPEPAQQAGSGQTTQVSVMPTVSSAGPAGPASNTTTAQSGEKDKHEIVAPFVGTFHVWARPRGGALVAVGDRVKVGQLVGTIQSLNVLNEVETSVAGRVTEVLVQDGQPVEYGQVLMTIESSDGAKSA